MDESIDRRCARCGIRQSNLDHSAYCGPEEWDSEKSIAEAEYRYRYGDKWYLLAPVSDSHKAKYFCPRCAKRLLDDLAYVRYKQTLKR